MNKEINYLSLPDFYNKYLLTNFNQKFNTKNKIKLQFKLANKNHLGAALKALYLLELIFPRKASVIKIQLKKKKLLFGQKVNDAIHFSFGLVLSSIEFIEFFRFFSKQPLNLNKKKLESFAITNRKLKQFDFNHVIYLSNNYHYNSFCYFNNYHLN